MRRGSSTRHKEAVVLMLMLVLMLVSVLSLQFQVVALSLLSLLSSSDYTPREQST